MVERQQVLNWLAENVSVERLEHILGVEETAKELASFHQVDENKAAIAGLLHDLAKFFPPNRLLVMAREEGLEIDQVCLHNPHLLHADVSAIVARREFGVKDPEILEAIALHTLGKPDMSDLSCVVFVADALEPNRGNTPEIKSLRLTSKKNLYKAVWQTCDYSLGYLLKKSLTIHPRTVLTRNWALQIVKKIEPK